MVLLLLLVFMVCWCLDFSFTIPYPSYNRPLIIQSMILNNSSFLWYICARSFSSLSSVLQFPSFGRAVSASRLRWLLLFSATFTFLRPMSTSFRYLPSAALTISPGARRDSMQIKRVLWWINGKSASLYLYYSTFRAMYCLPISSSVSPNTILLAISSSSPLLHWSSFFSPSASSLLLPTSASTICCVPVVNYRQNI